VSSPTPTIESSAARARQRKHLEAMRPIMGLIKLTVNEEKTCVCRLPDEMFDFLG
jgi:hypothetical protein